MKFSGDSALREPTKITPPQKKKKKNIIFEYYSYLKYILITRLLLWSSQISLKYFISLRILMEKSIFLDMTMNKYLNEKVDLIWNEMKKKITSFGRCILSIKA